MNRLTDPDFWFGSIFFTSLISLLIITIIALTADHTPQCQYTKTSSYRGVSIYSIMHKINWGEDIIAYSTSNPVEMIVAMQSYNICEGE